MPELPEVETIVRELRAAQLEGRTIVGAAVYWPRTVSPLEPGKFCCEITGQRIKHITRRGKWIEIHLTHHQLFIHLRMTGKLLFRRSSDSQHPHERLRLELDDGRMLSYEDQRKFGRWRLVPEGSELVSVGVDPFSKAFTWQFFERAIKGRFRQMKPLLLDQKVISGLGNIYVDEALWEAKIHPLRRSDTLTAKEMKDLFQAIPLVLSRGIENQGTTLGDHRANYFSVSGRRGGNQFKLRVFRREGEACYRCKSVIKKMVVGQRGTHFCPLCQPLA